MELQKLNFDRNYNNKLRCKVFTSLRLPDDKYKRGARFEISLGGYPKGTAKVIGLSYVTCDKLSEWIAKLDTGFTVKETIQLLKSLYKDRPCMDWKTGQLVYLLLEWEGQERMSDIFTVSDRSET